MAPPICSVRRILRSIPHYSRINFEGYPIHIYPRSQRLCLHAAECLASQELSVQAALRHTGVGFYVGG